MRKLLQPIILFLLILFSFSEFSPSLLLADTIILKNGTLLVGKVKRENSKIILFKNYYGEFKIPAKQIKQLFKTANYEEDIEIRKKMGKDFDENEIRKNYEAGLKDIKNQKEDEKKPEKPLWGGGKIFLTGIFNYIFGDLNGSIPYGYGGFLAYDQGPDLLTGGRRLPWIPGMRIEGGYLYFNKGDESLSSITISAGPLWQFFLNDGKWGIIGFSVQPGISLLTIKNINETADSNTFTLHSTLGYEYPFGRISLIVQARYMYIFDKDVLFNSAGVSAGVAFKIW